MLIPFFPERTQTGGYVEGQSTILVSLFPNQLKADLFERASRVSVDSRMTNSASEKRGKGIFLLTKSFTVAEMISDEVVNIFENAARFKHEEFEEEDVDGGI